MPVTAGAIAVFAGPSLPTGVRPRDRRFRWHPPAAAGDLLALLAEPPATICLIDGYFDSRPAPWHKEILLLIQSGVRVIGAASMGALRAAELDRHGMIGIGAIYRAYRSGQITGDDEVALIHTLEELGWQPVSEPLIEVRATLAAALRARILDGAAARTLRDAARSLHFAERDWPAILARAGWPQARAAGLLTWLDAGAVRLKQIDALACLAEAKRGRAPPRRGFAVPMTCFMQALAEECGVALSAAAGDGRPRRHRRPRAVKSRAGPSP